MFENIMNFLRKVTKKEDQTFKSKDAAKEMEEKFKAAGATVELK